MEVGTITGVVGPNGSGKTTLFNCISGVLRPDAGDILVGGVSIVGWPANRIARAGVGRTFQATRVFPRLTVQQNLEAAAFLAGKNTAESGKRFLDLFDLGRYRHVMAGELSFGQQKLVEFAAVMTTEPKLILLDEPASGISAASLAPLGDYIRQLRGRDRAILVVEHNMRFVFDLCEAAIVMNAGATIAAGPVDVIKRDERVLDAYLGVPDAP